MKGRFEMPPGTLTHAGHTPERISEFLLPIEKQDTERVHLAPYIIMPIASTSALPRIPYREAKMLTRWWGATWDEDGNLRLSGLRRAAEGATGIALSLLGSGIAVGTGIASAYFYSLAPHPGIFMPSIIVGGVAYSALKAGWNRIKWSFLGKADPADWHDPPTRKNKKPAK